MTMRCRDLNDPFAVCQSPLAPAGCLGSVMPRAQSSFPGGQLANRSVRMFLDSLLGSVKLKNIHCDAAKDKTDARGYCTRHAEGLAGDAERRPGRQRDGPARKGYRPGRQKVGPEGEPNQRRGRSSRTLVRDW